jgi:cation-transporting ATPase E
VVQQVNAVESLSNVDVLCMDKTGTLTANRLSLHGLQPLGKNSRRDVELLLGSFVRSTSAPNRTSEAIAAGIPGEKHTPADEVPFASSRKWSALAFDGDSLRGVYVLGALEALKPLLPPEAVTADAPLSAQAREWSDAGLRVLVFARNPDVGSLDDERGRPQLPTLAPLGVVGLGDALRTEAGEILAECKRLGIQAKIISGDDPRTVAALASRVGLVSETPPVSGLELAQMSEEEFDQAAATGTIFGRIEPSQKEKLIEKLVARGRYVAMIGDGVNDVLALKKAQLGIAMGSGSDATRRVADMVLIEDSFSALRPAFREGKRVAAGVTNAMCLFLTRVSVATLVIVAVSMLGLGFPFEPAHVALSYLTAGIPSFFLIIWARPETRQPELLRSLARFVIPAATVTMLIGVALYAGFYIRVLAGVQTYRIPASVVASFEAFTGLPYDADGQFGVAAATIVAQTALSIFITITAFVLILFLEPPMRFFTGWTAQRSDKRPALLALALSASLALIVMVPALARYVSLFPLGPGAAAAIALAVLLWTLALRTIWRTRLFERFVSLDTARGYAADGDH